MENSHLDPRDDINDVLKKIDELVYNDDETFFIYSFFQEKTYCITTNILYDSKDPNQIYEKRIKIMSSKEKFRSTPEEFLKLLESRNFEKKADWIETYFLPDWTGIMYDLR